MKSIHEQNYYELLEIEPNATQEEILRAYNRARATYGHNSPALYSLFNKEEAQELLRFIDEAYTVLSNQFKRKQYDNNKGFSKSDMAAQERTPPMPRVLERQTRAPQSDYAIPSASEMFSGEAPLDRPEIERSGDEFNVPVKTPEKQPASEVKRPGAYQVDHKFEEEIKALETFTGPVLQSIRMYKNISIDQIAEVTKVSRTYITAVEQDDYASLPAPVFVRGFLVQMARMLGINPEKVVTSYLKSMKAKK